MFVVEHIDDSMIDNLIVSLFYKEHKHNHILNKNVNNDYVIYLQEFIKEDIIGRMNNGISIRKKILNRLKEILLYCDSDILNGNICDFYDKFLKLLSCNLIKVNTKTVYLNYKHNQDIFREISYVSGNDIKTNDIVNNWLSNDYIKFNNMNLLCSNTLLNYPEYFTVRPINKDGCDIVNRIKIDNKKWYFRAAICFNKYYYSLIFINNQYLLYDTHSAPCFQVVKLNDINVVNRIRPYIMLVIYIKN